MPVPREHYGRDPEKSGTGRQMTTFLNWYLQGEYIQVWNDLQALGTGIYTSRVYDDALAVAFETMRRVRHNIEILLPRLERCGYQFGYDWMPVASPSDADWIAEQPARYTPPNDESLRRIKRFEQLAGSLPLSLRAFYSEVGEVNFVGTHPRWEEIFHAYTVAGLEPVNLDPLVVLGLSKELQDDYILWQKNGQAETTYYPLAISGDADLKYNGSEAGAYEIALPNSSIDGELLHEWHHTTFVNYLRICLHYGGLPGLERIQNVIPEELNYLRKDLLPF